MTQMNLSNRTLNALSRSGIKLDDLPRLYKEGLLDKIVGVGKKGVEEIIEYLKEKDHD